MEQDTIAYKNIYYPPGGILMWIIITLELITFGIALVVMVLYGNEEPELFHTSRLQLNASFGTANTIFLITSGYFMAQSVQLFKKSQERYAVQKLKLAILGGLLFLVLKGIEYYMKLDAGFTMGYNTFYSFYWMLTLFHVIHVIVGLVILYSIYIGARKKIIV